MVQFLKANAWIVLVVAALVGVLVMLVDPAPPREITMATGSEGGAYDRFGEILAARLQEDGLTLKLQNTKGSLENLELLADDESEVSIALVQTGLMLPDEESDLFSLGAMFPEPVWVFHRRDLRLRTLRDLRGRRVAIGEEGSGTRPVALSVLRANGLLSDDAAAVEISDLSGEEAQRGILDSQLDAMFVVSAAASPLIEELVTDPGLTFHGLRRTSAYAAQFRQMTTVDLGDGQLDLARNLPTEDRTMLAAVATLAINDRFHPGLAPLVLNAAADVLSEGDRVTPPGEFPAVGPTDFELTRESEHYFKYGLPFLMRYVNFWTASMFDRVIIFAIPLLILLFPVFKIAGPLYRWQTRRRIFRWYKHLREVDQRMRTGRIRETLDADIDNLRDLQHEILSVKVPLSYTDELYELHLHVDWVIDRLAGIKNEPEVAEEADPASA